MGDLPVAVDAMGGDDAPGAIVEGAAMAVRRGVPVVLVGDTEPVRALVPRAVDLPILHASEVVEMHESPAKAVRSKPDSSMRRALDELVGGRACAAVSCGNSGAWVVAAVMALGVVDGIERPAVATVLPRHDGGRLVLLDAGANVDCRPEQLVGFARLGAAYARALGVDEPRIGLLSNGEEDGKGNMLTRATLPLLVELPLAVVGNVEPTAALEGACDVLVCDGFVGNVLLKALEGAVELVVDLMKDEVKRRLSARMGTRLMARAFQGFRERVAWDAHGGALLLGVGGPVVVGHGRATPQAVASAIALAHRASRLGLVDRVRDGAVR